MSRDELDFPLISRALLEPYLPPPHPRTQSSSTSTYDKNNYNNDASLPFTTLTFATSLDSQLALSPGTQTALSGAPSKAMTHFLRARHDAILVGVGTLLADDPGLNCRMRRGGIGDPLYNGDEEHEGEEGLRGQPRPVVIDPCARWDLGSREWKVLRLAREGRGKAPWVVYDTRRVKKTPAHAEMLRSLGGEYVGVESKGEGARLEWVDILRALKARGVRSVMVEGGCVVINELLRDRYRDVVSSTIVTIAPVWLGAGGVVVAPPRQDGEHDGGEDGDGKSYVARLRDVRWIPMGDDIVLCGRRE